MIHTLNFGPDREGEARRGDNFVRSCQWEFGSPVHIQPRRDEMELLIALVFVDGCVCERITILWFRLPRQPSLHKPGTTRSDFKNPELDGFTAGDKVTSAPPLGVCSEEETQTVPRKNRHSTSRRFGPVHQGATESIDPFEDLAGACLLAPTRVKLFSTRSFVERLVHTPVNILCATEITEEDFPLRNTSRDLHYQIPMQQESVAVTQKMHQENPILYAIFLYEAVENTSLCPWTGDARGAEETADRWKLSQDNRYLSGTRRVEQHSARETESQIQQ
ncbi:hypothetical protein EYF80_043027 [Liparis tanakae]|uniref:Uncharacterized protein n=1 Tax=Liparis tanakae TaxID=230148 RepID=A0A4Z2G0Y0_9TELE|nr:hypothetical protein EYF80_043027 [Liparis tanakae]